MSESEGYRPREETRLEEFTRLADAMDEAEQKIEEGVDTSAAQLDRYFSTRMNYYHWLAQNPHPDHSPEERENSGEWYLRYKRLLNGSYHQEKANYALEQALFMKRRIERRERTINDPETGETTREAFLYHNSIGPESRRVEANWLRTTASCLEMPEARPLTPEQHPQTE